MFDKNTIYKKDKWLNEWVGGDVSDLIDLDILKNLMLQYYGFSVKQAHIYLNKYAFPVFFVQENSETVAKDISLKVLFDVASNVSQRKYQEQGKMEAYIRAFVECHVRRFLKFKNYLTQSLETTPLENKEDEIVDNSVEQFLDDCQEEVMQSGVIHAIRNVELLYQQKTFGKSLDELAEVEKTSVGNIKKQLWSARRILFDCVQKKKQQANA